jgi:hypothetical protein
MTAVASTVCKVNIRERLLWGNVGRVDAIAEQVVRRDIEPRAENAASDHSRSNVDDIIRGTATIGETGRIAPDQSQTASARERRRRYTGIEP